jgi:DNA-binding CsgD family transcriptional regulator
VVAVRRRAESLTPREREVLALVFGGLLNKQVGHPLGVVERTVKAHRARVMRKMGAGSLAELVRLAERIGVKAPPLAGAALVPKPHPHPSGVPFPGLYLPAAMAPPLPGRAGLQRRTRPTTLPFAFAAFPPRYARPHP